jgi:maleylpyruvate isomerase
MARTSQDSLRWMAEGQHLVDRAVAGLDEAPAFATDTVLPGWTRQHLVAHLAGNADALNNLATWAATGVETPMYRSPDERAAGIARGATMTRSDLAEWQERSARALADGLSRLTDEQWAREVRTAQGRLLPATEIPWLRAREVMVHAVDLDCGVTFTDLPADFLGELIADITAKRGELPAVDGSLADVAAWLSGRPHALVGAPDLGPWL